MTQFAIVLSNYAKIRNKVKSVMFIISDINYKVIYLLLLLYYYELIINMNFFLTWSKLSVFIPLGVLQII